MSSTWTGSAILTRLLQKSGFSDTTSSARTLEFINDIQTDLASSHAWPFLKFKMKKQIISGDQEIDISPDTPTAPTIALLASGSLTADSAVYVKCTFVLFSESGKEIDSLESEPSVASNTVTPTGTDLSLTITAIPLYSGSTSVKPTLIYRRLYIKVGSNPYYFAKEISDNTTVTTTITTAPSSTIEPPEYSLVSCMAGEDPLVEGSGVNLYHNKLEDLLRYDPTLSSTGLPQYYSRIGPTKVLLYPKPSATYTLTYWVYRIPARIFNDSDRAIQLHHSLKESLDAGVTWKWYEYKDSDGQESKKMNYEARKSDAKGIMGRTGGQAMTVKVVC